MVHKPLYHNEDIRQAGKEKSVGKNRGAKKTALRQRISQGPRRLTVADAREQGRPVIYLPADAGDVREIRNGLGISQAELAKRSGISRTAIADLETERYALSAFDGIELFTALARTASGAPEYREKAKQAALKLMAFQRENSRRKLEKLEKERREVEALAAELDAKEARLTAT